MARIPTTQRQYYNTQTKVNTLGAIAGSLLPAVQDYQRLRLNQEKIKIDTNATKARVEMDNIVNQWRLDNQADPDNEEAKMSLQQNLQSVLDKYGNQIAPLAKMDWDVTANKMLSGYQAANNDWAFTQRAENTKLNVAENINLNLDMAYRDGLNGNLLGGFANLDNSYKQLMTYAAPNLGEQGAKDLLSDYKSQYTTSFVNGLIESNPDAALEFLNDEGNQKALNSDRKLGALRQLAQKGVKTAQQKKIEQFKRDKTENYINFLENPTLDNLEYYVSNFEPEMSDEKYELLVEHVKSLNPQAVTDTPDEYILTMQSVANMPTTTPEEQQEYLDKTADAIDSLYKANKKGKIAQKDMEGSKQILVKMMKDPNLREQVKNMPTGKEFNQIISNVDVPLPDVPQIEDAVEVVNNGFVLKEEPPKGRITSREGLKRKVKTKKVEEEQPSEPIVYTSDAEAQSAIAELKDMPVDTEEQKIEFLRQVQTVYSGIYLGINSSDLDEKDLFNELSETTADKLFPQLEDLPQAGILDTAKESWREYTNTSVDLEDAHKKRDGFWSRFVDQFYPIKAVAENVGRSIGVWGTAWKKKKAIEQIKKETAHQMIGYMINGDYDAAQNAYKNGVKKAIRVQYPDVPDLQRDDLEPGKSLVTINGIPYKFMGYTADDILVEMQ